MRLLALLSSFLNVAAPVGAEPLSITSEFDAQQASAPQFALGLGYSTPISREIFADGPIYKGAEIRVDETARWHIGSITKSLTATLVLQQVERGTLSLDTPIGEYIPRNTHDDWRKLTLRMLLSHTAGLRRDPRFTQILANVPNSPSQTRRQILDTYWDKPTQRDPGVHEYSNLGYILIGFILEAVTATTWEELIIENIAKPLDLNSLGFGAPQGPGTPWGHRNLLIVQSPVDPSKPKADNPAWIGPAGTIHMSLGDLVKWGEAVIEACAGRLPMLLSADSCNQMVSPTAAEYGFGWVIDPNTSRIWHNGSNTMWYAILMLNPEENVVVAVTQNTLRPAETDRFAQAIFDRLTKSQD